MVKVPACGDIKYATMNLPCEALSDIGVTRPTISQKGQRRDVNPIRTLRS